MGGESGVDSVEGRGSSFWFTVQLGRVDTSAFAPEPRADLQGLQVLAVADSASTRQILIRYLCGWQAGCDGVACDGAALKALRKWVTLRPGDGRDKSTAHTVRAGLSLGRRDGARPGGSPATAATTSARDRWVSRRRRRETSADGFLLAGSCGPSPRSMDAEEAPIRAEPIGRL